MLAIPLLDLTQLVPPLADMKTPSPYVPVKILLSIEVIAKTSLFVRPSLKFTQFTPLSSDTKTPSVPVPAKILVPKDAKQRACGSVTGTQLAPLLLDKSTP